LGGDFNDHLVNFALMILAQLPDHARIWIYQANRQLSPSERQLVNERMEEFVKTWAAHGASLFGGAEVYKDRWLIVAVDESRIGASGCSIDTSVRQIKALGAELGIDFFDRTRVVWIDNGEEREDPMHDFWARRKAGLVTDDTLLFNSLAANLGELRKAPMIRFQDSWHAEMWR
jgi:hypothetical protein